MGDLVANTTFGTSMVSAKSNNSDCYYYYYSSCLKGSQCPYRHEPAALMNETMCRFWLNGHCSKPNCIFRHMEIVQPRDKIQCYYEKQPGGCKKVHCPYFHNNVLDQPREADRIKNPDIILPTRSSSPQEMERPRSVVSTLHQRTPSPTELNGTVTTSMSYTQSIQVRGQSPVIVSLIDSDSESSCGSPVKTMPVIPDGPNDIQHRIERDLELQLVRKIQEEEASILGYTFEEDMQSTETPVQNFVDEIEEIVEFEVEEASDSMATSTPQVNRPRPIRTILGNRSVSPAFHTTPTGGQFCHSFSTSQQTTPRDMSTSGGHRIGRKHRNLASFDTSSRKSSLMTTSNHDGERSTKNVVRNYHKSSSTSISSYASKRVRSPIYNEHRTVSIADKTKNLSQYTNGIKLQDTRNGANVFQEAAFNGRDRNVSVRSSSPVDRVNGNSFERKSRYSHERTLRLTDPDTSSRNDGTDDHYFHHTSSFSDDTGRFIRTANNNTNNNNDMNNTNRDYYNTRHISNSTHHNNNNIQSRLGVRKPATTRTEPDYGHEYQTPQQQQTNSSIQSEFRVKSLSEIRNERAEKRATNNGFQLEHSISNSNSIKDSPIRSVTKRKHSPISIVDAQQKKKIRLNPDATPFEPSKTIAAAATKATVTPITPKTIPTACTASSGSNAVSERGSSPSFEEVTAEQELLLLTQYEELDYEEDVYDDSDVFSI